MWARLEQGSRRFVADLRFAIDVVEMEEVDELYST
jgi:hypothetical protein